MDDTDWSNDASFDLDNIDTSLALLPQAAGSSASSPNTISNRPRGHRSSSSFSSRSSTSSLGQSPLQVNSPLRHSFTRDTAPDLALKTAGGGKEESGEVDFDEGFDDAFGDDAEPPARVKLSLDGLSGLNTDKLVSKGVGTVKARGTSASSNGSMYGITSSGTFMGVGPKGIGTITKLGGTSSTAAPSKPTNLASVKARAKAWEADLDLGDDDGFGDIGSGGNKGTIKAKSGPRALGGAGGAGALQLKLPNRPLPPPEDLDDLGFDLDDDERKDDDATLKAGTTLKAMLPPPRAKSAHISAPAPGTKPSVDALGAGRKADAEADFDLETDIVLPLNLTNLVLATKSHPTARNHAPPLSSAKGPRRSDASTSDTFGSISTGTNEWDDHHVKSKEERGTPSRTPYSHNTSVSDRLKYYSETSATSIDEPAELSSPTPSATYRYTAADTIKSNAQGGVMAKGFIRPPPTGPIGAVDPEWQEDDMELDMESGLVLPDPTFFAAGAQRSKELNGLLDRKRKQHYAPAPDVAAASTYSSRAKSTLGGHAALEGAGGEKLIRRDESMEDGFVFDNPRVELSNTRLKTQRRIRGGDPHVNPSHTGGSVRVSKRDRDGPGLKSIARSKEAGWKYQQNRSETPLAGPTQQPSPAPAQLPTASSRDASNPTPTPSRQTQVGSMRTRTQSAMHQPSPGGTSSMFAATHNSSGAAGAAGAAGTITPGRLRYQKSHAQISSVRGTTGNDGRSTSPTPLPRGAGGTLLRKQSLASLQDAMNRGGTPSGSTLDHARVGGTIKAASAFASIPSTTHGTTGGVDGLPGSATRDSLASLSSFASATPSRGDRERYHASTSRLTMPTSSSRAKTRPPIAGVFSRAGLGGAESPAPSSSAAGLAALAETDPIESRRISPPRNAAVSSTPSRMGTRRLVEPAQLLVPLSKRKPAQATVAVGGANATTTGSFGRKTRHWGDGSELEGIEDLVVDDGHTGHDMGSLGRKSKGGSVGRSGGIGLGRPSASRKDSQNDSTAARVPRPTTAEEKDKEKRHKSKTRADEKAAGTGKDASTTGSGSLRKKTKRPAMLIKHLGGVDKRKVVGEMTWNPRTLRWEGNESILASFDPPSISPSSSRPSSKAGAVRPGARPALITHLTPGSIGMTSVGDTRSRLSAPSFGPSNASKILTSPDKDRYSTIRIVGDMQFDPQKMCWVSLVPEEDAFEGMADDEDEDWGSGSGFGTVAGGTIRGSRGLLNIGASGVQGRMTSTSTTDTHWTHGTTGTQISLATAGSGSTFGPGSGSGSGAGAGNGYRPRESFGSVISDSPSKSSTATFDGEGDSDQWQAAISPELWAECQAAEERHRKEVKGWCVRPLPPPLGGGAGAGGSAGRAAQAQQAQWMKDVQERERREGKRLWEIRTLAMRS